MADSILQPPGEKMQKAILEFSEKLAQDPNGDRKKLLTQISTQFDLSPKECDFLQRHCVERDNKSSD